MVLYLLSNSNQTWYVLSYGQCHSGMYPEWEIWHLGSPGGSLKQVNLVQNYYFDDLCERIKAHGPHVKYGYVTYKIEPD